MKRVFSLILILLLLFGAVPGGYAADTALTLIETAVSLYESGGAEVNAEVDTLLAELETLDADLAARWREIFACWRTFDLDAFPDVLPDGLPEDDSLCIVVLGYQLNADGTMKGELEARLKVALRSAEKYPNAYILCTGGHTASENEKASEAGVMAKWLRKKGIARERILTESASLTTTANAEKTYALLTENYPSVTTLALISSDYHVCSGAVLLEAISLLSSPTAEEAPFHVAACAANVIRPGSRRSYAAGGLKTFARKFTKES